MTSVHNGIIEYMTKLKSIRNERLAFLAIHPFMKSVIAKTHNVIAHRSADVGSNVLHPLAVFPLTWRLRRYAAFIEVFTTLTPPSTILTSLFARFGIFIRKILIGREVSGKGFSVTPKIGQYSLWPIAKSIIDF